MTLSDMSAGGITEAARWSHLQRLLCRGSPLAHPDFEPSDEVRVRMLIEDRKIIENEEM